MGEQPGQCGFASAGRPLEDDRPELILLDHKPKRLFRPDKMFLPEKLAQRAGAQSLRKRERSGGRMGAFLFGKEVRHFVPRVLKQKNQRWLPMLALCVVMMTLVSLLIFLHTVDLFALP